MPDAVSRIAQAYPDRVEARGRRDLTGEVMGRLGFDLVPWGSLQRSEYKSKLVER